MRALIDGDIIVYRVGFASDSDDLSVAIHRCDAMLDGILEATRADNFRLFLTDAERNFRRQVWPMYHANRVKEKPRWYGEIKDYLINHWHAEIAYEQEADDAMGINQTEHTIICSIDKDLKQIPGRHYNFVKQEFVTVTNEEGMKWFYTQLLQGDTVDNVQGVPGIGKAKAEKLLKNCTTAEQMYKAAHKAYHLKFSEMGLPAKEIDEIIVRNARLLYIRKREGEIWNPPKLSTIPLSESTPNMPVETIQSTEPTQPEMVNGFVLHGLDLGESMSKPEAVST